MELNRLGRLIALSLASGMLHAAATDIADNPLAVVTSSEANIMFIVDNSGSMNNIVPPNNFTAGTTSCPVANQMVGAYATASAAAGGASFDTVILSNGTPRIKVYNTNTFYNYANTGTNANRCFEDTKYYQARLRGDSSQTNGNNANSPCGANNASCKAPSNYLWAIYRGDFLNWYYSGGTLGTVDNFGANADRKPGTETRLEAAKTASKAVIDTLDKVRVGLTTFNGGDGGSLREIMGTATAAKKTAVKAKIDAMTTDSFTPLAETLADIGRYFTTGYTGNLTLHPGAGNQSADTVANVFPHSIQNSSGQTVTAPVEYWCQKSFAVLMTDGRPQLDQNVSASLCDYLGIMGTCLTTGTNPHGQKTDSGTGTPPYHTRTVGATTFTQLHEGGDHSYESQGSDYLDDVAGALFDIDLRPDLKPTGGAGSTSKRNLSLYTIGFADEQAKIDPLLREAATAGGGFFRTANNTADLTQVFEDIVKDVEARTGAAAAVAVANAHVTQNDNASYSTSYNSGNWTGDLIAYPIDLGTGVPDTNSPIWNTGCGAVVTARLTADVVLGDASKGKRSCSAMIQLGELATPVTSRKIVTSTDTVPCNSGCGINFQPTTAPSGTKISVNQRTLLSTPTTTDGDAVVNYLRGANDSTYRTIDKIVDPPNSPATTDRMLMGDPINAEPLVVQTKPSRNYDDPGYATYKATVRTSVIIQAVNDGMVHAFNALTGAEEWAYIPNLLISNSRDPNNASTSLLNTRTRKVSFNHYPLIDATPVEADVDFGNTGVATPGTVDWRTIVVGGLGKGGRGFYALDVTSTTAATETLAANKVLWEFPNSVTNATARAAALNNTGYSFGKPIIVKTAAQGWVVLVTSGYNNGGSGDGEAHLFVLNAKTGDLIADIKTSNCTSTPASNPCGLAHISAYVEDSDHNNTVTQVYGGDLYGNLWRFDLTGATTASWSVAKLATLADGSNSPQPVTSAPELASISIAGVKKRFVYVGTGQYLGNSDLPCSATCPWTPNAQVTQTQTMYALVDPMTGATLAAPIRSNLVAQTYSLNADTPPKRVFSTNTVDFTTKNGWYVDFTGGERVVSDPAIAAGVLVFTSSIPSDAVCDAGGKSWLYTVDYKTGGQVPGASFSGTPILHGLASRPVLIQLDSGAVKALLRVSDATTATIDVPPQPGAVIAKRVSWRELVD